MIRALLVAMGLIDEKRSAPDPERQYIAHEKIDIKREHQMELRLLYDAINYSHLSQAGLFAFWSAAVAKYPEVGQGSWEVYWDKLDGFFRRYTYDFPSESNSASLKVMGQGIG